MPILGVVTGLRAEARLIETKSGREPSFDVRIRCAGADPSRALRLARELAQNGADALLSFGIAGGLDQKLSPGDLIVPRRICRVDGPPAACDGGWRDRLLKEIADMYPVNGDMAGSNRLITDIKAKQSLRDRTGAAAVDMESLAVGEIAVGAGIPFIAIRAIADPADRAPPLAVLAAIGENGDVKPGVAVFAALRDPSLVGTFASLARDNRAAMASLRRVARRCGPLFGLV